MWSEERKTNQLMELFLEGGAIVFPSIQTPCISLKTAEVNEYGKKYSKPIGRITTQDMPLKVRKQFPLQGRNPEFELRVQLLVDQSRERDQAINVDRCHPESVRTPDSP